MATPIDSTCEVLAGLGLRLQRLLLAGLSICGFIVVVIAANFAGFDTTVTLIAERRVDGFCASTSELGLNPRDCDSEKLARGIHGQEKNAWSTKVREHVDALPEADRESLIDSLAAISMARGRSSVWRTEKIPALDIAAPLPDLVIALCVALVLLAIWMRTLAEHLVAIMIQLLEYLHSTAGAQDSRPQERTLDLLRLSQVVPANLYFFWRGDGLLEPVRVAIVFAPTLAIVTVLVADTLGVLQALTGVGSGNAGVRWSWWPLHEAVTGWPIILLLARLLTLVGMLVVTWRTTNGVNTRLRAVAVIGAFFRWGDLVEAAIAEFVRRQFRAQNNTGRTDDPIADVRVELLVSTPMVDGAASTLLERLRSSRTGAIVITLRCSIRPRVGGDPRVHELNPSVEYLFARLPPIVADAPAATSAIVQLVEKLEGVTSLVAPLSAGPAVLATSSGSGPTVEHILCSG